MASATLCGSSQSTASGLPVATAQNPQLLVQILPRIIKVAVPAPQHSPILGQLPLSQIVCSLCSLTMPRTFTYSFPVGNFTRSQSGFLTLWISSVNDILKPFPAEHKSDMECYY